MTVCWHDPSVTCFIHSWRRMAMCVDPTPGEPARRGKGMLAVGLRWRRPRPQLPLIEDLTPRTLSAVEGVSEGGQGRGTVWVTVRLSPGGSAAGVQ